MFMAKTSLFLMKLHKFEIGKSSVISLVGALLAIYVIFGDGS